MLKKIIKVILLTESRLVNNNIAKALDPKTFQLLPFASDTPALVEKLAELEPDFVFLNTVLKGTNGFLLCDEIKAHPKMKEARIIFLSSDPNEVREQAIQRRATRFLPMPFSPDELNHAMEGLVDSRKTVLFVDDSKYFHKMIVSPLKEDGYDVLEAWDGKEALDVLQKQRADIVITDVEMPAMDGFSLCRSIKQEKGKAELPVLILSALNSEDEVKKGFDAGADDYITKPVVIAELLARVKRMLNKGRHERHERILVVEDAASTRKLICQILQMQGFQTDDAVNGQDALYMLSQQNYHLVITDYEMPVMNGYDMCLRVRQEESVADIPIIMVSARESKADLVKVRSTGIQSYISKPFRADRLVAEVERVLMESRIQKERQLVRHYLSGEAIDVVDRYWSASPGHEEETVVTDKYRTIMVANLVDFSSFYEEYSARDAVNILNAYFDKMLSVLTRYNAVVDRFIDEAVLSMFGSEEEGAQKAVSAALEMLGLLPELRKETGADLHIRIGVNSGHVIVGDVGSRISHREYSVVGNNVKIAQRLESMAEPDTVLISESTYGLVKNTVEVEPSKTLSYRSRGKQASLQVYRVKQILNSKPVVGT